MTACERLTMAEERLAKPGGWRQLRLRDYEGSYCLVGALCRDEEIEVYLDGRPVNEENLWLDLYQGKVYEIDPDGRAAYGAPIEGLDEAFKALGFENGHKAYAWNDNASRNRDEVLLRVSQAKAKTCPEKVR